LHPSPPPALAPKLLVGSAGNSATSAVQDMYRDNAHAPAPLGVYMRCA
jgi:hypothetical protein